MRIISRKEAVAQGLKRYFTGRRCVNGHCAERSLRSECVQCAREKNRAWYARNIEGERARCLAYRNSNIERCRENSRAYNQANLDRGATIARNRRARRRKNGGSHTLKDISEILLMQNGKCAYCRISLNSVRHVDHILPLALGGSNGRENLQILCVPCNKTKSAKHPIDFARSKGLLL